MLLMEIKEVGEEIVEESKEPKEGGEEGGNL